MKKKTVIITTISVLLILIVSIGIIGINNYKGSLEHKLKKVGYSKEETLKIINNYEDDIDIFLKKYYDIDSLFSIKEFDIKKIDEYDMYVSKFDSNYEEAIKMVNASLEDYKYEEILLSFKEDKWFKEDNIERYLDYYNSNKKDVRKIISEVNCNLDNEYYTNTMESVLSDNIKVIVNKYYYLPSNFVPDDLVTIGNGYGSGTIRKEVYEAFKRLSNDAKIENLNIYISSGYRSYETQDRIYNNYLKIDPKNIVDTYSARAGFSEHQTGLAIDVNSISDSFVNTKEYQWLSKNAYKYGFILRYPKDYINLTGYKFEPWHYRYVGIDIAKYIEEHNITYDEYYEYYLKDKDKS